MATTLGTLNPFRYRGYVYDEETGLYYLRSRYYNPTWGRIVNADSVLGKPGQLLDHNVFAYCRNNPVHYYDPNGYSVLDFLGDAYYYISKTGQLLFWNGVVKSLEIGGLKFSSKFLKASLQPRPQGISYNNDSVIADIIKSNPQYQVKLAQVIDTWTEDTDVEYDYIVFTDHDLFGALHKAEFSVFRFEINDRIQYSIRIYDIYNFEWISEANYQSTFKCIAYVGNNMATIDQARGVINPYCINIWLIEDGGPIQ